MIEKINYSKLETLIDSTFKEKTRLPNYIFINKYEHHIYLKLLLVNHGVRSALFKGIINLINLTGEDFFYFGYLTNNFLDNTSDCLKIYKNTTVEEWDSTVYLTDKNGHYIFCQPGCRNFIFGTNPKSWAICFDYSSFGVLGVNGYSRDLITNCFQLEAQVMYGTLDEFFETRRVINPIAFKTYISIARNYPNK